MSGRLGFKIWATGILLLLTTGSHAHTVNHYMEQAAPEHVIRYYFGLGIEHIVPDGWDHILFITALCLLSPKPRLIFWQATAFTVAHSITLALSMKNIIHLPAGIVEPVIALSIVFVAIENILFNNLKAGRLIIVFLFGLLHGLGFAGSLNETGLPRNQFFTSIISFNAGVEVGQLLVIAAVYGMLVYPFRNRENFRRVIVAPVSLLIGAVALYWTYERVFGLPGI